MNVETLQSLFLALVFSGVLGALVGIDKDIGKYQKSSSTQKNLGNNFGSIRTFALISIFGGLMTWVDALFDQQYIFVLVGLLLVSAFVLVHYTYSVFRNTDISPATEIIAILTYFIGVLVFLGYGQFAIIFAIILTFLVSSKDLLEGLGKKISSEELSTTLKFATIAFVILPLLPDYRYSISEIVDIFSTNTVLTHPLTTFHFFNPHSIWLFVVVMSGISYLGYILTKFTSKDSSIILSSILGGMVSSTATTASMTQKSKEDPGNTNSYVIGTLLASCIMFLRVFAIVAVFSFAVLKAIAIPGGIMFFVFLVATAYFYFQAAKDKSKKQVDTQNDVRSPFRILPALQFAGVIVVIKFISGVGIVYKDIWGEEVFYSALGLVSGLADVDAITQTMSVDAERGLVTLTVAASTILLAVMSNNFIKGILAWRLGNKDFGRKVMGNFVISIFTGALCIMLF